MSPLSHRRISGFTLTELAIVLAVVGVLAAGLWNLMSGANTQVRDESAASMQREIISSAKAYLASSEGTNTFMGGIAASSSATLPLPNSSADAGGSPTCAANGAVAGIDPGICNYLPPGFWSGTTNPYGQTFNIRVLKDSTPAPNPPATYSVMILTTGGTAITDTSGARISSLIGNDGGFVYTANVCGPPTTTACGSFGGWTNATATYGFAGPPYSGDIASRTYVSPDSILNSQWLARLPINLDTIFQYNSMTVPEYLGSHALVMGSYPPAGFPAPDNTKTFYLGDYTAAPPPNNGGTIEMQGGVINFLYNAPVAPGITGTMNVQGGTINLGGGTITGNSIAGNPIPVNITGSGGSPFLVNLGISGLGGANSPPLNITTGCTRDAAAAFPGFILDPTCSVGMQLISDGSVAGQLTANSLFSQTFIYQSSDIRLKTDIHPLDNSLTEIMQLKPVTFVFKSSGQKGLGVLAQDVEKIYPELVSQNNGMKAVNYDGFIAPLIDAVQDLKRENDKLREQINAQAARQKQLENQLETLRQGDQLP